MNARAPIYPQPCVKFIAPNLAGAEFIDMWGTGHWFPTMESYNRYVPF